MIPDDITARWFAFQPIRDAAFLLNDSVSVVSGQFSGETAAVISLRELSRNPLYDIELSDGSTVQARQSELLPLESRTDTQLLARLQRWYSAQCDGSWEHDLGPQITTIDNPGWRLTVPLSGTSLAHKAFTPVRRHSDGSDWISCQVRDDVFEGACGPHGLIHVLGLFLEWSEADSRAV